ncbi:PAC2 family protein [Luteococcus sanguinis]|uniref:PAC2 family protein n=1 Tax=Luteococcus sanguinis TaxID=174038 RepID=A0ABW1X5I2_9ACTN
MSESLSNLRRPVAILAFDGWNDAADAATAAVDHLASSYDAEMVFEVDGEDYYDFQVNRPMVVKDGSHSEIIWPALRLSIAHLPSRDLVLVQGPEPNFRWRAFSQSLVSALRTVRPELVIVMGAMLSDSPHSRPVAVSGTTDDAELASKLGLEMSDYEGPTGITGVVSEACRRAGLPVVSLWAAVPHYVSEPPNPPATLALVTRIEDLLDEALDLADLPEQAQAWHRGVDELAAEDPDIAEYIARLEARQDEEELPEATGDAIAAEFQRYLRRRGQGK